MTWLCFWFFGWQTSFPFWRHFPIVTVGVEG